MALPFLDFAPQVRRVAPLPAPEPPPEPQGPAWGARADLAPQTARLAPLAPAPRPVQVIRYPHMRKLPDGDLAPAVKPVSLYYDPSSPLDADWRDRAVCAGKGETPQGIRLWFPGPGGSQRGKLYCAVCPVRRECDDYATRNGITWGIWGGKIRSRTKTHPDRKSLAA